MSRRRSNRKPIRFIRTSKQTPRVLKRLRGGTTQKDLSFLQDRVALKQQSLILELKVEIADCIKKAKPVYMTHLYYMEALTKLIDDSLKLIKETYHDDTDVNRLKAEVDLMLRLAQHTGNKQYYDLRDVYDMIVDFFYKKATNMLSSDTTFPSAA